MELCLRSTADMIDALNKKDSWITVRYQAKAIAGVMLHVMDGYRSKLMGEMIEETEALLEEMKKVQKKMLKAEKKEEAKKKALEENDDDEDDEEDDEDDEDED